MQLFENMDTFILTNVGRFKMFFSGITSALIFFSFFFHVKYRTEIALRAPGKTQTKLEKSRFLFSFSTKDLLTYTAPVWDGRLLGTARKSSPVTKIFLFGSLPISSHLQPDGQPRR